MIKTIKVKKKLRLDELIQKVWDGQLPSKIYVSDKGLKEISVIDSGVDCNYIDNGIITSGDTFTVEVEEEITEDAPFEDIVILHINGISHLGRGAYHSIRSIRRDYPTVTEIRTLINGKLELIWEAESDEL